MLRKTISCFLLIAAVYFVIAGRVKTFHLTEGEALAYGWEYWLASLACGLTASLLLPNA